MPAWKRVGLAAWACCLVLVVVGCPGKTRARRAPAAPKPAVSSAPAGLHLSGGNTAFVFPSHGPRLWSAQVKAIDYSQDMRTLTLTGVQCTLYQQGKETLRVTADTGTAVLDGDKSIRVQLTGHVQATEPVAGRRLTAARLHWASTDGRILAEQIKIDGPAMSGQARRGTFSTDLAQAELIGKVKYQMERTW